MNAFFPPITSIRYAKGTDPLPSLRRIVEAARAKGLRVAGALQYDTVIPGRRRCQMALEDLSTGRLHAISEDRGPGARGCNLDLGLLAEAETALLAGLAAEGADLVVINKFGKSEAMGAGLRGVIVAALETETPLVIGVPLVNLDAWQAFVDGLAGEVAHDLPEDGSIPGILARGLGLSDGQREGRGRRAAFARAGPPAADGRPRR